MKNLRSLVLSGVLVVGLGLPGMGAEKHAEGADREFAEQPDKHSNVDGSRKHWPKPPLVDFVHVDLDVTMPDLSVAAVKISQQLVVKGIKEETETIELDGPSPKWAKMTKIEAKGRRMIFVHRNEKMSIDVMPALKRGEELTLTFEFDLKLGGKPGVGLIYVPGDAKATPAIAPMVYSQGQSEWNHLWFFCHDFPNERMTSAVTMRVPRGVTTVSNGTLEEVEEPAGEGLMVWKWNQEQPHAAYLISLAMGKFERIEMASAKGVGTDGKDVPVDVYVEPGKGAIARQRFADTGAMIEFFAKQFDEPYPFDKYSQTTVRAFSWGGMENSSATTLTDLAVASDVPTDPTLISHELAHQWLGNLVTCRTWEHVWLNEGWATYAESLWSAEAARREGENAQAAYLEGLLKYRGGLVEAYAKDEGSREPMASAVYAAPDDVFEKSDDPYAKGAWVLHMLRERLGDEAFWRGTREYVNRWKFREVETGDFRRSMEEASGETLERFFDDWVYRFGMPRIVVRVEPVMEQVGGEDGHHFKVRVEQTNPDGSPRALRVPLELVGKGGRRDVMVTMEGAVWEEVVTTDFAVERGEVDPEATVLATWDVDGSKIPLCDTCGAWNRSQNESTKKEATPTITPEP
ncbi:MAG: M1 family metallopeptidase [Planctomycetes bacterium]|nr:M1 family metallopeptidase [Planctomycetota bacterium]